MLSESEIIKVGNVCNHDYVLLETENGGLLVIFLKKTLAITYPTNTTKGVNNVIRRALRLFKEGKIEAVRVPIGFYDKAFRVGRPREIKINVIGGK